MPSSLHRLHSDHSDQPPEIQEKNTHTASPRRKRMLCRYQTSPMLEDPRSWPGPHASVPWVLSGFNFLSASITPNLSGCSLCNMEYTNPWWSTAQNKAVLKAPIWSLWLKTYKELGGATLHQDLQVLMWSPRDTSSSQHKLEHSQSFAEAPKGRSQSALNQKYTKVVQNQHRSKPYPVSCSTCWSAVCETKPKDCPFSSCTDCCLMTPFVC